ncbi:NAD(P)-dependent oxidoreductase [Paenibacillus sp. GP183]|uniref:NAD-dependent epimerase/dehydratase family protein n=1 Tax=Paenibacillus sp. GP183 TaxID=1882751 RepID=UPI00089A2560|nr:NAD(P)-dependent oxidoreductase [Paenibacillus sp. GP183]SEC12816.1 dTDP-6-deoxy-L-talose 4-dehydrogenase (NAD+) [Paenibacillus sp. GP183]
MSNIKSVVVTGAGGYIGRHVVKTLLDLGIVVRTIDSSKKEIDNRAETLEVDIFANNETIYEDLGKPDVCLHMAWKDGFVHNAESHMQNLHAHYKFIKNMVNGGLKHITVMGTMHEVGYYIGEINEDTPTNPYSYYGIAKNTLRQSLNVLLKDKDVVFQWLRAYYIYGDDTKNNSIFAKIIQAEDEGKEIFPFTTGKNMYDFISVEELSNQIAMSSLQTEINGIINCCSGVPVALREMVENFLIKNEFKIKLQYGAFPDRPYDSPAIWGSNEKIKKIIKNSNYSKDTIYSSESQSGIRSK